MHLASNIDPMRHLGSVKDDQCGNNRNVSKCQQGKTNSLEIACAMTPNNTECKDQSGSYSAHATPRRRKSSLLSANQSSAHTEDDLNMNESQPTKGIDSSSSQYFQDTFGHKLSQYLSTISFSNPFQSFSNESLLNERGKEKENRNVISTHAKNVDESITSICANENESLVSKHAIYSEVETKKMCNTSYKNSCQDKKCNSSIRPDSTLSVSTTTKDICTNSSDAKMPRSEKDEKSQFKVFRSLTSSSIKRDNLTDENISQLKRNQGYDSNTSSSVTRKPKKPELKHGNHTNKKTNLESSSNSNEACNKKLCTRETLKHHPLKVGKSKSFENKSSITKNGSHANSSSCTTEHESRKANGFVVNKINLGNEPKNQTKYSQPLISNNEKSQSLLKRKRIRKKCTIHTFGMVKHHVLSMSSRSEPITAESQSKLQNGKEISEKPNYTSLEILPSSLTTKNLENCVEKPSERTSSIRNLKARLLANELKNQTDQNSTLVNTLQKPSFPSSNISKSFFMSKETARFYNRPYRYDPIHELELSETTCSLPNTPVKKRSNLVEDSNLECDKTYQSLNYKTEKSNFSRPSNLAYPFPTSATTRTPFNRSITSLNHEAVSKSNRPICPASKGKSQSVQTLCSQNDNEHLSNLPNAAMVGLSSKQLPKRIHSVLKQSSCYRDKHWKVRVWSELSNFSLDFNGSVRVNNNNVILNISPIPPHEVGTNLKNEGMLMNNISPREESHPLGFLGFRSLSNTPRGSGDLSLSSSSIPNLSQQHLFNENVLIQFEHTCKPSISYTKDIWSFQTKRINRTESCCEPKTTSKETRCSDINKSLTFDKTNNANQVRSKRLNDILWYRFLSRLDNN